MSYQSINPFDGKTVKTFEELTDEQLDTAIETAADSFEKWRDTSFAGRGAIATKAASILRERIDEFAHFVTLEMGKLIVQARGEVELSADNMDSGYGRELSSLGIQEFVNKKLVRVQSIDAPV